MPKASRMTGSLHRKARNATITPKPRYITTLLTYLTDCTQPSTAVLTASCIPSAAVLTTSCIPSAAVLTTSCMPSEKDSTASFPADCRGSLDPNQWNHAVAGSVLREGEVTVTSRGAHDEPCIAMLHFGDSWPCKSSSTSTREQDLPVLVFVVGGGGAGCWVQIPAGGERDSSLLGSSMRLEPDLRLFKPMGRG